MRQKKMPRRRVLTEIEKRSLLVIPTDLAEMSKYYLLSEKDMSIIDQRRGLHNKIGFTLLLCCMRYPGISLNEETDIPEETIKFILNQIDITDFENWRNYFIREQTRREHLVELHHLFGFKIFNNSHYELMLQELLPLTKQTDKGITIANEAIILLRKSAIVLPSLAVIERLCAEAITVGNQEFYNDLTKTLSTTNRGRLDALLQLRTSTKISYLHWLLQFVNIPKPKHLLLHIERLIYIKSLDLPTSLGKNVHYSRLIKLAREGKNMPASEIQKFEPNRRYATIIAILFDARASIIDEIIELNDKILGSIFNKAKQSHNTEFQSAGKSINDKLNIYSKIGQALISAKNNNENPFQAIEAIISWDEFTKTVNDTSKLTKSDNFDFLYKITSHYSWVKRYVVEFLDVLEFKASGNTTELLSALSIVKEMHQKKMRKVPDTAPNSFIKKRWNNLIFKEDGSVDRQFYEFAVLSELKNALRSGDIWVVGSRQYKDFDEYLVDKNTFNKLKAESLLPVIGQCSFDDFIKDRLELLTSNLDEVHKLTVNNELPDATISDAGLKVTPLKNSVPDEAYVYNQKIYSLLPRIKITDLLQEVDSWINYTQHFTHLKNDKNTESKQLLLTAILADAINLGLTKMAEACPGTTYSKLASIQAWYIREDTYKQAQAVITNAQHQQELTKYWGKGNSSSSDGQWFKAGGSNERAASVNPKYGSEPGVMYYCHISDLYAPFHMQIITSNLRDSTYVLDGLLHHEADLNIYEHYTDTAGFTDHVFALMHLLGFKFAPRIRDLNDKKIYLPNKSSNYPKLSSMVGGHINLSLIEKNWDEIIRLALSIKHGTVTSSLILRKLGSYPRQNNLATALRELGKIERTIFMLEWVKDPQLRRRVQAGLNKGEAKHALTRAVHFNRLGEIRDRTFENQLQRASGLNLVVSAIILWNTVYIQQAVEYLRKNDKNFNDDLIKHSSPLIWEHINLTGDYTWNTKFKTSTLRID